MVEDHLIELTNEIHGHVGIYSILGVKMGLRAVEAYQAAGGAPSLISVVSYAGSLPPVSCFSDGLQISTGATLGRGRIRVSQEGGARPEAEFHCEGMVLRLRLKPEYLEKIQDYIRTGTEQYGRTPQYWSYIQDIAMRIWKEWDREVLFESL